MIEHAAQRDLHAKHAALRARLLELPNALVAFSGGVDSALVLRAAVEVLGAERVLAVTGRSPSVPQAELRAVSALAAECGAPHEFLDTREFEDPNYTANPNNRCYFCKSELYDQLTELARQRGYAAILNGANADDYEDYRPGLQAAGKFSVRAPLAEAGLTKDDVRALAAALGVSIHAKPASPCLSSRIPYGEPVTPEKLRKIDAAETLLRELGFAQCRVRHHGENLARLEVPAEEIERLMTPELRARIDARLREIGYQYVCVDIRGFRSGSLNEVLLGAGLQRHAARG